MSTIISSADITITPLAVSAYSTTRAARNIVHDILGRNDPDVTFRPTGLRTGTLTLTFSSEDDSSDAEGALSDGTSFLLLSDDLSTVGMAFIVGPEGAQIQRSQGPAGEWVVSVDFQEVTT